MGPLHWFRWKIGCLKPCISLPNIEASVGFPWFQFWDRNPAISEVDSPFLCSKILPQLPLYPKCHDSSKSPDFRWRSKKQTKIGWHLYPKNPKNPPWKPTPAPPCCAGCRKSSTYVERRTDVVAKTLGISPTVHEGKHRKTCGNHQAKLEFDEEYGCSQPTLGVFIIKKMGLTSPNGGFTSKIHKVLENGHLPSTNLPV